MLNDDQYMERTPDVIAKIRWMREAAEKEMNRFTRLADYDVRRVVGKKPGDLVEPVTAQRSLEFSSDIAEYGDECEQQP